MREEESKKRVVIFNRFIIDYDNTSETVRALCTCVHGNWFLDCEVGSCLIEKTMKE